jgi:hypothetical protein
VRLFHRVGVGGEDSALVRARLVQTPLRESCDFCNIAYDSHLQALRELTGSDQVPVLDFQDGRPPLIGKNAILNHLSSL